MIIFRLFLMCLAYSSLLVLSNPARAENLQHFADSLLSQHVLRGSSWSILIKSLRTDSVLYSYQCDRLLIPASLTKLVTTATALDQLGPEYRCETTGYSYSSVDAQGTLHGDVYIDAGGDPTTDPRALTASGSPLLESWVDSLSLRGINKISGNLVMRCWPYRLECAEPLWEVGDVNSNIAPVVDGFGYFSNVCRIAIKPGAAVDSPAVFVMTPPYAPIAIRSSVVTCDASEEGWVNYHIVTGDSLVVLTGETPVTDDEQYLWLPVQDPARFLGNALVAALDSHHVEFTGRVRVERGPFRKQAGHEYFTNRSPRLADIIKVVNKESDNYAAEYVLRALAVNSGGPGDRSSGIKQVEKFLRGAGIDADEIRVQDGCGLARQNLASAAGMVELLTAMARHANSSEFVQSLSVSGVDGTLSNRLSTPQVRGKVQGKTGTMTLVANVAGYAYPADGDTLVFALLCNNFSSSPRVVRAVQDQILEFTLSANSTELRP